MNAVMRTVDAREEDTVSGLVSLSLSLSFVRMADTGLRRVRPPIRQTKACRVCYSTSVLHAQYVLAQHWDRQLLLSYRRITWQTHTHARTHSAAQTGLA